MNIGAKKIPAMLRMKLWLGLEGDSEQFQLGMTDASIAVFAETVRLLIKRTIKNNNNNTWFLNRGVSKRLDLFSARYVELRSDV